MIIDFHSHVLPRIDDGSRSLEMTRDLLMESKRQGITVQVATPHFYASHNDPANFLKKRAESYALVKPVAEELGIELLLGAEVAYFRDIGESKDLDSFLIGDTDLLLLEMPFRQWTDKDIRDVKMIQRKGILPIIAHIERFLGFQKDKGPMEMLFATDAVLQVNAEALLSFGTRGKVLKLFKEGKAKLLASDCHNTSDRPQNLQKGREMIDRKLGQSTLALIDEMGEKLLSRRR